MNGCLLQLETKTEVPETKAKELLLEDEEQVNLIKGKQKDVTMLEEEGNKGRKSYSFFVKRRTSRRNKQSSVKSLKLSSRFSFEMKKEEM